MRGGRSRASRSSRREESHAINRHSFSELRSILGVSSSLYNDAYLEGIIDTSEAVILPMLVANSNAVNAFKLKDNVATCTTHSASTIS
jgi:hypothetical protein